MIEHALWVTTDRFEASTPGADFINPIRFGQDFAVWLQSRLAELGVVVSEPIQEDWGWAILVSSTGRKFTISIGVMDETQGQVPAVWRIGVAYEKPLNSIRSWFGPAPAEPLLALFHELRTVLEGERRFNVSEVEP